MDKELKLFNQWMKDKGYSTKYSGFINTENGGHCTPTPQMLIGFKLEYLIEKGIHSGGGMDDYELIGLDRFIDNAVDFLEDEK